MKKLIIPSAVLLAAFSLTGTSVACDLHGAGYGSFGIRGANWQPYNPQVSTTDPAFSDNEYSSATNYDSVPANKAKPSFSNAAALAATKAKSRFAQKSKPKKLSLSALKSKSKKAAALNTDR